MSDPPSSRLVDDRELRSVENIFCKREDLRNEASVEDFFLMRLIKYLDYPDNRIQPKESIEKREIPKGSKTENYKPDYVLLDASDDPVIVLDAKSTEESPEDYHYQVSGYSLLINQQYTDRNPVRYSVVTNGEVFIVYPWDSDQPIFYLRFQEFKEGNEKFKELESTLSYKAFNQTEATEDIFEFYRPELGKLTKDFKKCHNLIWKKEKYRPTKAFYEFAKLMFLKINHDQKIHNKVESEENLDDSDFYFSTHWIEEQVNIRPNPFNQILFSDLQEKLEREIREENKKRIFDEGEELELKPSTIKEVVGVLENYDLYGIGEDLNGRMFETFLKSTIRGEELGQYFTPRSIVNYMVNTANIDVSRNNIDSVLDGCCGTGGFLIEAMASMLSQVRNLDQLTSAEKEEKETEVKNKKLWGADANSSITRIARLNMYLHGDGGNNIYETPDFLDKDLIIEEGIDDEIKKGMKELKETLIDDNRKFDYVLTNPPFSMKYSKNEEGDKKVLQKYDISKYKGKLKSIKSKVLFLERYYECLEEDGELLTIIDDTILNGTSYLNKHFRKWILNHFIIKQIISLPFNTFFKADANIKTSILHLKKRREDEEQGDIFMGITNNIGHDDHCEDTPDKDNMPILERHYQEYYETGEVETIIKNNQIEWESLSCPMQIFKVQPEELNEDRLDAFYYSPALKKLRGKLRDLESDDEINLLKGRDLNIVDNLSKDEREKLSDKRVKYVEISDVTPTGDIIDFNVDYYRDQPNRAKIRVYEGDIVFARNISSRGTAFIVPEWFDGNIVSDGFMVIRPESEERRLLLWSFFISQLFTTQQYYLCLTASQPELREETFEKEVLIPLPIKEDIKKDIKKSANKINEYRKKLKQSFSDLENSKLSMLSSFEEDMLS